MSEKRRIVKSVLEGKKPERVPVGFWFHFFEDELVEATSNEALIVRNVEGHRAFIEAFNPDFIKLMSDGYFNYPNPIISLAATEDELSVIQSIGENHPWIEEQITLVTRQRAQFKEDIYSFYNIFSPVTYLKFLLGGDAQFVEFVNSYSAATINHVLTIVANDIAVLSARVIQEAGADGIYFSTQNIRSIIETEIFENIVKPNDLIVLNAANEAGGTNILHICGFEGAKNRLEDFIDYPAQIVNWATAVENVSLVEGHQLFPDKVVLGGFGNTTEDLIFAGTQVAIQSETEKIIDSFSDSPSLLIGADCTVPRETPLEHLEWVRQAAINQSAIVE